MAVTGAEAVLYRETVAGLRHDLAAGAIEAALSDGKEMTLDDAVAYALSHLE